MRSERGQQRAVGAQPPRVTPVAALRVPDPPAPKPWKAKVIRRQWGFWQITATNGMLEMTYGGDRGVSAFGSERHAIAKAKRIVDRLNYRDRLRRAQDENGIEVT